MQSNNSSGDPRSKPLGKGRRKMTQAGGHEMRKAVRSKFARKSTTTVQKVDRGVAPKGPFFQKSRRKHQKWCDQRENFRPKIGPTRKLCDRCRHRPNRRVKCRICKRAVGPCCMATDEPNPLCKDCWEPDPEQTKTQRDEVFQPEDSTARRRKAKGIQVLDDGTGTDARDLANKFDGLFNDVDDNDQANYVSDSSEDELN